MVGFDRSFTLVLEKISKILRKLGLDIEMGEGGYKEIMSKEEWERFNESE